MRINTDKTCDHCANAFICRYAEDFQVEINKWTEKQNNVGIMKVAVSCDYFKDSREDTYIKPAWSNGITLESYK